MENHFGKKSKSGNGFSQGLVLSFILVFLISLTGGILIYRQLRASLAFRPLQMEMARENIYDVSQILNELYQSEAYARSYMQTFEPAYYYGYHACLDSAVERLWSMRARQIVEDASLTEKVDTIGRILRKKTQNMERLFAYMNTLRQQNLEEASRRIIDSLQIETPWLPPRIEIGEYADTVVKVERRTENTDGFFRRLSKAFKKEQVDTVYYVHQENRIIEETMQPLEGLHDSLRQAIARTVMEYEDMRRVADARLSRQIDRVLLLDLSLNEQIMEVLDAWQQTEVEASLQVLRQRAEDLRRMSQTIAWIGVLSFLVTFLALFFLLRSALRSQKRERALAVSEAEKAALLSNREHLMKSIAHDIKSPLSTIIGSTDLLDRSDLPAESKHYLSCTKAASSYLLELVNNLLDYVKWQSGELKSEQTLFNPYTLFAEVQAVYRLQAEEKGLLFRFFVQGEEIGAVPQEFPGTAESSGSPASLPPAESSCPVEEPAGSMRASWFKGDALRIRQICGNLLSNAIKYTDSGFVDFRVDWAENELRLRVKDSGQGIAEEDQKRIFEEFVRVGKEKAGVEGTGLGLSVTLKWVELLGGKLRLESALEKGSEFHVALPVQEVDGSEVEQKALGNKERQEEWASDSLRHARVAVIDDDRMLQKILCAYLERMGMEVRATSNPDELMAWVAEAWPQLVVTDLQMPRVSGYEVLERVKAVDAGLPVILLTGKHFVDMPAVSGLVPEAGAGPASAAKALFSMVLQKPVEFRTLLEAIEKCLLGNKGGVSPVEDGVSNAIDACGNAPADGRAGVPADAGGGDTYDLSSIRAFIGDGKSQMSAFLQDFFDTVFDQIEDLKIHAEEGDELRLSALAHKMASMCGQLGLLELQDLLRRWEKGGTVPAMQDILDLEARLQSLRCRMGRDGLLDSE